jgi:hypothetical protein
MRLLKPASKAKIDYGEEQSDDKTRNLVLRFWNLASSDRREIALELRLIEPEDIRLPEAERYGRAFKKAGELGLLERIAEEIQTRERT